MRVQETTITWRHEETGDIQTVVYLAPNFTEDRSRINDHIATNPDAQSSQADLDAYRDACERGVAKIKAVTSRGVDI